MYVLTLSNGKSLKYYVQECAEAFRRCYGGMITKE